MRNPKGSGVVAITCVRDEGAFLINWLAHHRAVGVDHFVVFSNDCTDGTDAMLDHYASLGWLTHVRNDGPYGTKGIQFTALNQAAKMPVVKEADWILSIDVDEFINIHVGDRTLEALMTARPAADVFMLTWRLFGNAGIQQFEDRPVTETFVRAAPEVLFWPWQHAMFKTLYRNTGVYKKPGVHRPRALQDGMEDRVVWVDGEGRRLSSQFATKGVIAPFGRPNYGLVQLNHYPLGAMESFILKVARGRVNRSEGDFGLGYWVDRNFNQVEETSITTFAAGQALRADMAADPVLAALHQKAVDWRRTRFENLMADVTYRDLYGQLLLCAPSQEVPKELALELYAKIGPAGA